MLSIQIALQNEHGGHLVNDCLAGFAGAACGIQMTMGLSSAETLVPEHDGQLQLLAQLSGKGLRGHGAWADISRHIKRQAHDDSRAAMTAHQAGQRTHIVAALRAVQRQQRLRGSAQLIRDGHAYAAIAVIEAENAYWK